MDARVSLRPRRRPDAAAPGSVTSSVSPRIVRSQTARPAAARPVSEFSKNQSASGAAELTRARQSSVPRTAERPMLERSTDRDAGGLPSASARAMRTMLACRRAVGTA